MNLLPAAFGLLASQLVIVHPVKDEATLTMLRAATSERDPVVRELAEEALAFIANPHATNRSVQLPALENPDWTDEEVLQHLTDPDAWRRETAVRMAGARQLTAAEPALVVALSDPDERLRQAAARALAQLRRGASAALSRLEVEPSRRMRHLLVDMAVAVHDPATRQGLLQLLSHARGETREAAILALARWGEPELAMSIAPLLTDPHPSVQTAAATALATLAHPATEQPLLDALERVAPTTLPIVVRALGELRSVAAIPRIGDWVMSTNDTLAAAAAEALGKIPDARVIALLKRPLERILYQQVTVRPIAIRYLRERGVADMAERMAQIAADQVVPPPPLIPEPAYDSPDARREALLYLQRFGTRAHAEYILNRIEPVPPAELRADLARTLSALTGEPYEPVLSEEYRSYFLESLARWERNLPRGGVRKVTPTRAP